MYDFSPTINTTAIGSRIPGNDAVGNGEFLTPGRVLAGIIDFAVDFCSAAKNTTSLEGGIP